MSAFYSGFRSVTTHSPRDNGQSAHWKLFATESLQMKRQYSCDNEHPTCRVYMQKFLIGMGCAAFIVVITIFITGCFAGTDFVKFVLIPI